MKLSTFFPAFSLILFFPALFFLSAPGPEKEGLPADLPPLHCLARASKAPGEPLTVRVTVPAMKARVQGKLVPKRAWPHVDVTVEARTMHIVLDPDAPSQLSGSTFFDARGEPVSPEAILERLEKETPILLSATGRKIDPYYLRVVKPRTLCLVLGPRDGAPALDLVPTVAARE